MDRLAGFLEWRRWIVLAAWLLLLLAALPFAAKQTDHPTSGGFEVPGSQSQVVRENILRFDGAQDDQLAAVLARREGAGAESVRAEVDRVQRIADELPHVALTPAAAERAKREAARRVHNRGASAGRGIFHIEPETRSTGRWNWWLPKRVDRVLPHAGFEGRSGRREPALDLGS